MLIMLGGCLPYSTLGIGPQPAPRPPGNLRVYERSQEIQALMGEAVDLDGSLDTQNQTAALAGCIRPPLEDCRAAAQNMKNRVAAKSGLALALIRHVSSNQPFEVNDQLLKEALSLVHEAVDLARTEQVQRENEKQEKARKEQARLDREKAEREQKVEAAREFEQETRSCAESAASLAACKGKCNEGDNMMCAATGQALFEKGDLFGAGVVANKGCDRNGAWACDLVQKLAKMAKSAWFDVADAGDTLVRATAQLQQAARLGERDKHAGVYLNAIVTERWCPQKKSFIQRFGAAVFREYAEAHCSKEPPTIPGLSGVPVSLGPQCRQTFATGCP